MSFQARLGQVMGGKRQSGFLYALLATGAGTAFSDLPPASPNLSAPGKVPKRDSLRLAGVRTSQEASVALSRAGHLSGGLPLFLAVGENSRTESDCCPVPVSSVEWSSTDPGGWHEPPGNQD